MSHPIVILRSDDGARLAALDAACVDMPADAEDWAAAIDQPSMLALGVEAEDGALAGMLTVSLTPDLADIHDIQVHPSHRRHGIASALLGAALRRAGERGIARMSLDVSAANSGARALYSSFGFSEDGRRARYYRDGSDAILLSRAVSGFAGLAP